MAVPWLSSQAVITAKRRTTLNDLLVYLNARKSEERGRHKLRTNRLPRKPTPAEVERQQRYDRAHETLTKRLDGFIDVLTQLLHRPAEEAA